MATYTEKADATWIPASSGVWLTQNLSSGLFNVPANAVAEIFMSTISAVNDLGVRAVGSALNRTVKLHTSNGADGSPARMHVQTDSNSEIEVFASGPDINNVLFKLVGYWSGVTYVELASGFAASTTGSWGQENLNSGIGDGDIAEIIVVNNATSVDYSGGVRKVGSSLDRSIIVARSTAVDPGTFMTIFAKASGNNGTIEVFSENSELDFFLLGFWSEPPGAYTETLSVLTDPSVDATWENASTTLPSNVIAEVVCTNGDTSISNQMGIRASGSIQDRQIRVDAIIAGDGRECISYHVNAQEAGSFQIYQQDVSDVHEFTVFGYWTISDVTISSGNLDFVMPDTHEIISVSGDLVIPAVLDILQSSGTLLAIGDQTIQSSGTLFAEGFEVFSVSGNLVIPDPFDISQSSGTLLTPGHEPTSSGVDLVVPDAFDVLQSSGTLRIEGHETISGSGDLVVPNTFSVLQSSGTLKIDGHEIISASGDLVIPNIFGTLQSSGTLKIGGFEIISASGDLVVPATSDILESSGTLFEIGHQSIQSSGTLLVIGHQAEQPSETLFIIGHQTIQSSEELFGTGHQPIQSSGTLFEIGHQPIQSSGTLRIEGHETLSVSGDLAMPNTFDVSQSSGTLWTEGFVEVESGVTLFIEGTTADALFETVVDAFLRTADFDPVIIGSFSPSVSGVTVEIWNLIDGVNTQLSIANAICFPIGNTGRCGWSTANLPAANRNSGQYLFRMMDSTGITFVGEFFLNAPEE